MGYHLTGHCAYHKQGTVCFCCCERRHTGSSPHLPLWILLLLQKGVLLEPSAAGWVLLVKASSVQWAKVLSYSKSHSLLQHFSLTWLNYLTKDYRGGDSLPPFARILLRMCCTSSAHAISQINCSMGLFHFQKREASKLQIYVFLMILWNFRKATMHVEIFCI